MNGYLLGIDNGGTVTKAALFNTEGHELAVASRKVKIIQMFSGWNERDANQMWNDTCNVIHEVLHKSRVNPSEILAVACTGHGNGLYLVDANGNPVRNAINSTDTRAQKYIDEWRTTGVGETVRPYTAQSLWAGQPNALLSWLRDQEPHTLQQAKWMLMAKDFTRMKLTGEFFAEITDMSGTSLMNIRKRDYDDRVLNIFGLEELRNLLPPLIGSADLSGRISSKAASETGLKAGIPVAGGMFDVDACALASGIIDEEQISLVLGTWGNNQYIAKEPLIDKDLFMSSIYSIPGWYLILEGSPTSVSNLDWFVKTFLSREKEEMDDRLFDWMDSLVSSVTPEETNVIFLPFIFGCNEKADLKACFYGLDGDTNRSMLLRSVYEGIVFSHRHHIERLLKFRDKPRVIRCSGGATQSKVWMQLFADIIGVPIEISEGTQVGAMGAAMAAGVCARVYKDFPEAIVKMTRIRQQFEPDNNWSATYEKKYQQYKSFVRQIMTCS
ncbi:MAG: FGGY-family carbohydrate kinase [Prolixibacteraceae bacterium]